MLGATGSNPMTAFMKLDFRMGRRFILRIMKIILGEISEGFNPTLGENSEAVSSPAQSPNQGRGGGGRGEGGALPLLLNDSDDSL